MKAIHLPICWIAALLPMPALAQPVPSNSFRCVEETLTIEDREIALVLMFVRYGDTRQDRVFWLRGVAVATRMLEAGRARCQKLHGWTRSRAQHARDYAFRSLLVEIVRQRVERDGTRKAEPIERYYARHRASLAGKIDPDSEQGQAFTEFLVEQGWDPESPEEFETARSYLEVLRERGESEYQFGLKSGSTDEAIPAGPASRERR